MGGASTGGWGIDVIGWGLNSGRCKHRRVGVRHEGVGLKQSQGAKNCPSSV